MIPQYTFAGDYTVEAIEKASQEVAKFDAGMHSAARSVSNQTDACSSDDWFVITVTDANFGRYNITPEYITRTMAKFPRVKNAVICLGDGLEVALYVCFYFTSSFVAESATGLHRSSQKRSSGYRILQISRMY